MDSKEFDKNIKSLIGESEINPSARPDWDQFSKLLSHEDGFEFVQFDQQVNEKLAQHETHYNSDHWILLKNRLEKEERLHRHIFISKTLEICAVLLLVFTFMHLFPDHQHSSLPITTIKPSLLTDENVVVTNSATSKEVLKQINYQSNHRLINQPLPIVTIFEKKQELQKYSFAKDLFSAEKNEAKKNDVIRKDDQDDNPIYDTQKGVQLEFIPLLQPMINGQIERIPSPLQVQVFSRDHFNPKKYITPFLSAGIAITNTPKDASLNLTKQSILTSNFSFGALYSSKKSNSEIITGLALSRKNYVPQSSPKSLVVNDMQYTEDIKQISYDFVSIPLHFKYFIPSKKSLQPFIKTGVDFNILMDAKYNIERKKIGVIHGATAEASPRLPMVEEEQKPEGFLNSGKLANNTYLAVNAEVGFEKYLNERNRFTMGLSYSKYFMIEGLGPNRDKYDALCLNIGVKHAIN